MTPQPHFTYTPTHDVTRIEDLNRREFISSALGAALLIACGDDEESASPPAPATRLVETPFGPVRVPLSPRRVVALGEEFMLADLLDLGIRPIASTASAGGTFQGLGQFDLEDIRPLSNTEPDIEGLVALRPDMLVVYTVVAEAIGIEILNQIAPMVAIDPDDYRASYASLASAFGLEAKAEARLAEYDTAVKAAGEMLGASARSVSVVTIYPGASITVWVGGPADLPQTLLDMGFALVPDAETLPPTGSLNRAEISLEQVDLLAGNDLLMLQSGTVEGEDAAIEEITSSDTWQLIPAMAADRVNAFDRLGHPGVPGRMALVEEIKAALAD